MKEIKTNLLPCNGCTVCCQGDAIYMHPECGDDPSEYQTVEYNGRTILDHKPNRDCIYLERGKGCTIWERRPAICREYDCRSILSWSKKQQFLMIKKGLITKHQYNIAKKMKAKTRFQ